MARSRGKDRIIHCSSKLFLSVQGGTGDRRNAFRYIPCPSQPRLSSQRGSANSASLRYLYNRSLLSRHHLIQQLSHRPMRL